MQHNSYSKEKVSKILKLFNQGLNPTDIARELGTYNTTIRRILLREGKTLKGPSETQAKIKNNPFLNEGSSYWIGFIAGDGNIYKNRVKIGLKPSDEPHLLKYTNFLEYDLNILTDINGEGKETKVAQFKSKKVASWFRSIGIKPNKSDTLKMSKNYKLTSHFLRGVMDADGYVRCKRGRVTVEIASNSLHFTKQLSTFLKNSKVKHTLRTLNSGLNIIGIYTQKEVLTLWLLLYKDAKWFLTRKAKIFLNGPLIQKWVNENIPNSGNPKTQDLLSYGNPELAKLFKKLGQV